MWMCALLLRATFPKMTTTRYPPFSQLKWATLLESMDYGLHNTAPDPIENSLPLDPNLNWANGLTLVQRKWHTFPEPTVPSGDTTPAHSRTNHTVSTHSDDRYRQKLVESLRQKVQPASYWQFTSMTLSWLSFTTTSQPLDMPLRNCPRFLLQSYLPPPTQSPEKLCLPSINNPLKAYLCSLSTARICPIKSQKTIFYPTQPLSLSVH
ncbi:hypothetical protein BDV35DRAFT_375391 [Aspergillus flavus]|uniref:Uncharacterized protein n=1 Tax=Aspergillus flavus TaxID=5059 RepID=A0A5N6HG03_ASPFL|nr:hypothetical protein BDV35DRAFT_375391 [Aspergillus flavus]